MHVHVLSSFIVTVLQLYMAIGLPYWPNALHSQCINLCPAQVLIFTKWDQISIEQATYYVNNIFIPATQS